MYRLYNEDEGLSNTHLIRCLASLYKIAAELKGEASNRDALLSPVCIYVCMYGFTLVYCNLYCIYVYMYICISGSVNPRHTRLHNSPVFSEALTTTKCFTWPPSATKLLNTPLHCCMILIVVNVAHCSSEGYIPVGNSTILSGVICPAWSGTLSLFPQVKCTMCTVLAQQGRAFLRSSKYVDVSCQAGIKCFV